MATTVYFSIDPGYATEDLNVIARQGTTQIALVAATVTETAGGEFVASASLDLSSANDGTVSLVVREASTGILAATGSLAVTAGEGEGEDTALLTDIKAKTDLIGTFGATVPVRYTGTGIQLYIGEIQTVVIDTTTSLSAKTLVIEFDGRDQVQVAVIPDGAITKTATTLSFAATTTITAKPQTLSYAVRDTTSKEVYVYGKCSVDYQPLP